MNTLHEIRDRGSVQTRDETDILIHVIPRKKYDAAGWRFFCPYCFVWHKHGIGLGGRNSHCFSKDSPLYCKHYVIVDLTGDNDGEVSTRKPSRKGT